MDINKIYSVVNALLDSYIKEGIKPEHLLTYLNTDEANYKLIYNKAYRKLTLENVQFESDTLTECLIDSIRDKVALLNDLANKKSSVKTASPIKEYRENAYKLAYDRAKVLGTDLLFKKVTNWTHDMSSMTDDQPSEFRAYMETLCQRKDLTDAQKAELYFFIKQGAEGVGDIVNDYYLKLLNYVPTVKPKPEEKLPKRELWNNLTNTDESKSALVNETSAYPAYKLDDTIVVPKQSDRGKLCIIKTEIVGQTKIFCPHCNDEILEKSIFMSGEENGSYMIYHRPCYESGPISYPSSLPEKKPLNDLNEIIDIQCQDGNWNDSPYMHGLANGLILAKSILDGSEPNYKNAPDKWKSNESNTVTDRRLFAAYFAQYKNKHQ